MAQRYVYKEHTQFVINCSDIDVNEVRDSETEGWQRQCDIYSHQSTPCDFALLVEHHDLEKIYGWVKLYLFHDVEQPVDVNGSR